MAADRKTLLALAKRCERADGSAVTPAPSVTDLPPAGPRRPRPLPHPTVGVGAPLDLPFSGGAARGPRR